MGDTRAQPSPCTSDERGPATKRACTGGAAAAPGRNGAPPSPRANSGSAGTRAACEASSELQQVPAAQAAQAASRLREQRAEGIPPELVDASTSFSGDGGGDGGAPLRPGDRVCRCGKTKCLKQYCACFRNDVRCSPSECKCTDCLNDGQHEQERMMAVQSLRLALHSRRSKMVRCVLPACSRFTRARSRPSRPYLFLTTQTDGNARAVQPARAVQAYKGTHMEIDGQTVTTPKGSVGTVHGCRCKRSRCLKKYCACYGVGLKCGENCICEDCQNGNAPAPASGALTLENKNKCSCHLPDCLECCVRMGSKQVCYCNGGVPLVFGLWLPRFWHGNCVACAKKNGSKTLCYCDEGEPRFWKGNCVACAKDKGSKALCYCDEGEPRFWEGNCVACAKKNGSKTLCSLSKYCGGGEPRFKSHCLFCRRWDRFFGKSSVSLEDVRAGLDRSLARLQQARQETAKDMVE